MKNEHNNQDIKRAQTAVAQLLAHAPRWQPNRWDSSDKIPQLTTETADVVTASQTFTDIAMKYNATKLTQLLGEVDRNGSDEIITLQTLVENLPAMIKEAENAQRLASKLKEHIQYDELGDHSRSIETVPDDPRGPLNELVERVGAAHDQLSSSTETLREFHTAGLKALGDLSPHVMPVM